MLPSPMILTTEEDPPMSYPKSAPPSSKLKVFRDTLEELLSNGHKVLVFSQFVDHLALVLLLLWL